MQNYTKNELQQILSNELNSIENLYKAPIVNWKGKTKDTQEYYTNLISDELLMNLSLFNSIKQVTRNSSYKVDSHCKIEIDCSSNRHEEIFAKRITGLHFDELGKIIDFQVPLKNSQKDGGLGKIDLLSYNQETKTLYLIELKHKGNEETLLRATLECYTYIKTIDKIKLINDYFNSSQFILNKALSSVNPNEIKVKTAVLLTPDCYAYDELEDVEIGDKPKLKALLLALEVDVFTIDISTHNSNL